MNKPISREMPKDLFTKFIGLYQRNPCLWNQDSPDYYNKVSKSASYQNLVDLIKPLFPNADKDFVKAKIQSIRGCHRKVCLKIKSRKSTVSSPGEVHKPSLWYFDLLQFLRDKDDELTLTNSNTEQEDSIATEANQVVSESEGGTLSTQDEVARSLIQNTGRRATKNSNAFINNRSRKKRKLLQKNRDKENICISKTNDEFDPIGSLYASKLRRIKNEDQRHLCENLMNKVILMASRNELKENSSISDINNNESNPNLESANSPMIIVKSSTVHINTAASSINSRNKNSRTNLQPDSFHNNSNSANPETDSIQNLIRDSNIEFNETLTTDNASLSTQNLRTCVLPGESHRNLHSVDTLLNPGNSTSVLGDLDPFIDQWINENCSPNLTKVDCPADLSWDSGNSSTMQLLEIPPVDNSTTSPAEDFGNIL